MNIVLIGYGRMGKQVETLCLERGHIVTRRIDPLLDATAVDLNSDKLLADADVCIEFTHPDSVLNNIQTVVSKNIPMVTGTTGWFGQIPEVKQLVESAGTGFVYAPNFSLGMNLYFKMVASVAKTMNLFPSYDVAGFEAHHNGKADTPSGTAKTIAEILLENINRKKKTIYHPGDRKIEPQELHFASLRCGSVPGTHSVLFDSEADTIELRHTARNRRGFAAGAVAAAEWILDKKGFYSFQDVLDDILKTSN